MCQQNHILALELFVLFGYIGRLRQFTDFNATAETGRTGSQHAGTVTEEALNNFYHHHDSTEVGQEQQCITESKVKATMKKPSN